MILGHFDSVGAEISLMPSGFYIDDRGLLGDFEEASWPGSAASTDEGFAWFKMQLFFLQILTNVHFVTAVTKIRLVGLGYWSLLEAYTAYLILSLSKAMPREHWAIIFVSFHQKLFFSHGVFQAFMLVLLLRAGIVSAYGYKRN